MAKFVKVPVKNHKGEYYINPEHILIIAQKGKEATLVINDVSETEIEIQMSAVEFMKLLRYSE